MPAKFNFEKDMPRIEKRVGDLETGVKKLAAMQKKKYTEFETLKNALWEGKDLIEENQKSLKKEKDPKKIKELAEEIEEQEKTFKKISAKLDPMVKELTEMGTTAGNLKRTMEDEQKTVEAMEKEVTKTAGDVKDLKAWADSLKALAKTLKQSIMSAGDLESEAKGLPKVPKL